MNKLDAIFDLQISSREASRSTGLSSPRIRELRREHPELCALRGEALEKAIQNGGVISLKTLSKLRAAGQTSSEKTEKTEKTEKAEETPGETVLLRSELAETRKRLTALTKEAAAVDRLVEVMQSAAGDGYAPKLPVVPAKKARQTPEAAVALLSDTHIGLVVEPRQTMDHGCYNFQIFKDRLWMWTKTVHGLVTEHSATPIQELHVPMLGDMLDGWLDHGAEAGHTNTLVAQLYAAGHCIAQALQILAKEVPTLYVWTCVGNHSRWPSQKKMPTKNRFSNLDTILYCYVEALLKNQTNIRWHIDEQPYAVWKVFDWTFMGMHGDHLRGGDKAFGIPLHAIGRQLSATNQLSAQRQTPAPNYYLCGHFHREIQIPHGLGDLTINGAFPGVDNYALSGNFNPVPATQQFFRVHPKYGKTARYTIQLRFAEEGTSRFDVPDRFRIV